MTTPRMPDRDTAGRSSPESPIDAATVLENAADQLLIHGRCRTDLEGPAGEMCVMKALAEGTRPFDHQRVCWRLYDVARRVLEGHLDDGIVFWNEDTDDDDEVRDTLLLVAKELRGQAVPS